MARTGLMNVNSWSIRSKIVLASGLALLFSTGVVTVQAALHTQSMEEEDTRQGIIAQARAHARALQGRLDATLQQAKTLAQAFSAVKDEEAMLDLPREAAIGILRIALSNDEHFSAVGTVWEANAYDEMDESYQDSPGHDGSGRFAPLWRRGDDGPELVANEGYQPATVGNYYERCKGQATPLLDALQRAPETGRPTARMLAPVSDGTTFFGAVRIDLELDFATGLLDGTDGTSCFLDERGDVFAGAVEDPALQAVLASDAVAAAIAAGEPAFTDVGDKIVRLEPIGWQGDRTRWWSAVTIDRGTLTAAADAMLWKGLLLGLLASGGAVALLWFLAGRIAMPISASAARMQTIAANGGDLTAQLPVLSDDEGGRVASAFNAFQQLLRDLLENVQQTAQSLEQGTGGISAASDEVSRLAQDAAASLHGANDQLCQFANSLKTTSESAGEAKHHADSSVSLVDGGLENMRELQETMRAILSDSTEIAQIVKVIDDIAFQTNLLALNAAVEAARAGDAGKGFAVVAEEVRGLALRSAESARSTAEFVSSACKRAEDGAKLSTDVDQMLAEVARATREVQRLMGNIDAETDEQSQSVEQVQRSVARLDQISQANAACAEEMAGSAQISAGNAHDLTQIVGRFRI